MVKKGKVLIFFKVENMVWKLEMCQYAHFFTILFIYLISSFSIRIGVRYPWTSQKSGENPRLYRPRHRIGMRSL